MNKDKIAVKKMMKFPATSFWRWGINTICMNTCECSEMVMLSIDKGRAYLEKNHRTWGCDFFGDDQRVVDSIVTWKTKKSIEWFMDMLLKNGRIMNMM